MQLVHSSPGTAPCVLLLDFRMGVKHPCARTLCLSPLYSCRNTVTPDVLQVRLMEFSPNEKYAVSYSAEEPRGPREKASLTLNIFDTFSGVRLCRVLFSPPYVASSLVLSDEQTPA
jgi:hypothetical protein